MHRGITVSRILACIAILLFGMPLYAGTLRIGFACHDEAGTHRVFAESLFSYVADAVKATGLDSSFALATVRRTKETLRGKLLAERHASLAAKEGFVDAFPLGDPVVDPPETVEPAWIDLGLSDPLAKAVRSDDRIVLEYLFSVHALDMLASCSIEPFDAFVRVRLFLRSGPTDEAELLFDRIALPSVVSGLLDEARLALVTHLAKTAYGMVVMDTDAPNLTVSVDGKAVAPIQETLLLEPGTHVLQLDAYGHDPSTVSVVVESNAVQRISPDLVRSGQRPLLVTSTSRNAVISIPGEQERPLPFLWESVLVPFAIHARSNGMKEMTVQSSEEAQHLELSFEVPWMHQGSQVLRSQEAMYRSLGRTLLFGALTITIDTLAASISTNDEGMIAWQPLLLGAAGAMGVSLVDTALRLFAYYQKTKYSFP